MGMQLVQTPTGGVALRDELSSGMGLIVQSIGFNVARAPTNTVVVGTLPSNAVIIGIFVKVPVVSNAVTTATVSIGLDGGSATLFTAAQDVKTAIGNFVQTATANWVPATAKQVVNCTYTETGGASTLGSITVDVLYRVA